MAILPAVILVSFHEGPDSPEVAFLVDFILVLLEVEDGRVVLVLLVVNVVDEGELDEQSLRLYFVQAVIRDDGVAVRQVQFTVPDLF